MICRECSICLRGCCCHFCIVISHHDYYVIMWDHLDSMWSSQPSKEVVGCHAKHGRTVLWCARNGEDHQKFLLLHYLWSHAEGQAGYRVRRELACYCRLQAWAKIYWPARTHWNRKLMVVQLAWNIQFGLVSDVQCVYIYILIWYHILYQCYIHELISHYSSAAFCWTSLHPGPHRGAQRPSPLQPWGEAGRVVGGANAGDTRQMASAVGNIINAGLTFGKHQTSHEYPHLSPHVIINTCPIHGHRTPHTQFNNHINHQQKSGVAAGSWGCCQLSRIFIHGSGPRTLFFARNEKIRLFQGWRWHKKNR